MIGQASLFSLLCVDTNLFLLLRKMMDFDKLLERHQQDNEVRTVLSFNGLVGGRSTDRLCQVS